VINQIYAYALFNHLYANIDGYNIASAAKKKSLIGSKDDLLYGEIPFDSWKRIVERAKPKEDAFFFDLGSGTGRVVVQSHLLFNFRKSVGVELIEGLYSKACETKEVFERIVKPQIKDHIGERELCFYKGNILDTDVADADFILLPHPFKKEEDFLRLEEKFLRQLKPGTKIVTLIRSLRNQAFKDLGYEMFDFSWGESTAYFYEV